MEKQRRIKAGERAKDFVLEDQNEKEFRLSEMEGRRVLLSFHPLAWTSVCADQMKSLETNRARLGDLNTVAVGVSVDTVPSKKAWAKSLGIEGTRLLSDFWPHGAIAELYGIFRKDDGISERANIILDERQNVSFVKVYEIGKLPDIEEVLGHIKRMGQEGERMEEK